VAVEPKMERKEITTTAAGFDFAIEFRQLLAHLGRQDRRSASPVTGVVLPHRLPDRRRSFSGIRPTARPAGAEFATVHDAPDRGTFGPRRIDSPMFLLLADCS
jgi:hypothetical protein